MAPDALAGLEIRAVEVDEVEAFAHAFSAAFGVEVREPELDMWWRPLIEPDRTLAVLDAGRIVATAALLSMEITLPGGLVPMAGVSAVGVHPTHRRRGILRTLMHRMLADAAGHGEPVAGLWASESVIYGRFGFGWAASGMGMEVQQPYARLAPPTDLVGAVRLVDTEEALETCPAIYDRLRTNVPGMLRRDQARWKGWLEHDPEHQREGGGPRFHAVLEGRGYAFYRVRPRWTDSGPEHALEVIEVVAVDPAAHAALWGWLFSIDLVRHIRASNLPVDDPLALILPDPRRLRTSWSDTLWLRPLHIPRLLGARGYAADGTVVLAVQDAFLPRVGGRFRLTAAEGTANCEPTDTAPDIVLSTADLGATLLGGTSFRRLARAGRITEHEAGALDQVDALFAADPLPWCPFEF
jgi:predicted acetyltransferase